AVCALVSRQARGALVAEWQFNSYSGGTPSPTPDFGTQSGTATLTATAGTSVSLTSVAGTPLNQNTASSPNDALEFGSTSGSSGQNSLTLHISGTGLQNFVLTYASSGNGSD